MPASNKPLNSAYPKTCVLAILTWNADDVLAAATVNIQLREALDTEIPVSDHHSEIHSEIQSTMQAPFFKQTVSKESNQSAP
jgi:hypothetical protein